MIHAMIDLETLSTNPDAVILTVGGVKFDPYTILRKEIMLFFGDDLFYVYFLWTYIDSYNATMD